MCHRKSEKHRRSIKRLTSRVLAQKVTAKMNHNQTINSRGKWHNAGKYQLGNSLPEGKTKVQHSLLVSVVSDHPHNTYKKDSHLKMRETAISSSQLLFILGNSIVSVRNALFTQTLTPGSCPEQALICWPQTSCPGTVEMASSIFEVLLKGPSVFSLSTPPDSYEADSGFTVTKLTCSHAQHLWACEHWNISYVHRSHASRDILYSRWDARAAHLWFVIMAQDHEAALDAKDRQGGSEHSVWERDPSKLWLTPPRGLIFTSVRHLNLFDWL